MKAGALFRRARGAPGPARAGGGWPYAAGAAAFGLLEALFTLWTGRTIGITSHLIGLPVAFPRLGSPRGGLVLAGALLAAGVVAGAALGAAAGGEWRLRLPRRLQPMLLAAVGGFLMGVGARLAPGCNVGGVIGGIASSSLQGWVEGLCMLAGAAAGVALAVLAESGVRLRGRGAAASRGTGSPGAGDAGAAVRG